MLLPRYFSPKQFNGSVFESKAFRESPQPVRLLRLDCQKSNESL